MMHRSKAYASAAQKDSIVLPDRHFVPIPLVGGLHHRRLHANITLLTSSVLELLQSVPNADE